MTDNSSAIITVNLVNHGAKHDMEVPLDISANELCSALFQIFLPEKRENVNLYYLRSEKPIALLRGEKTLREYGIRDGSIINITK